MFFSWKVVFLNISTLTLYRWVGRLQSGFTDLGSNPGQGKIINVPVFYHEMNTVLRASNV